ncbi:carbohydrate ABC transporter permease [Streptomyces sp. RKAG293]|uniref:carbohydrate ABC transporter permease n=1 Tax=Streptomyces sp. RKAG293 TaxID=2893403 RepID=UPI00203437FD|nr:sugar ABC transporter permease [Streptomyces sp. RKAG293]MCM2422786.1 sugar ABC transporter permease [Streptomyces sp. RKAG293]
MKLGILLPDRERVSPRRPRSAKSAGAVPGPPGPRHTLRRRRLVASLTGWSFALPATLIIAALTLFPAVWSFLISRERWNGFTPPKPVGWANYQAMAHDQDLQSAVNHTVLFTVLYVPVALLLGLFLASALNRKIRFIGFYRTAIFVPLVMSAAASGILAKFVFDPQFGLADNGLRALHLPAQGFLTDRHQVMWVIALIYLWGDLGFSVIVYLAALQDIPKDIIEAATLDGANRRQIFRHVTLPSVAPVTLFIGVWETISVLQIFELILTTTRGGPLGASQTVVYFIYNQAFQLSRYGYGSAIAYLLFAATLLLTLGLLAYSKRTKREAF